MITNLNDLADRLKGVKIEGQEITAEKLKELMASENEVKVEVDPINTFTEQELGTLKENTKKEGYNEGKEAGSEMTIKEIKNQKGLDFEGKTVENLVKHYDQKVLNDANIEPDKKVKEWEQSYNQLKTTYEQEKQNYEQQLTTAQKEKKDMLITDKLRQGFNGLKGVDYEDAALIAKNKFNFDLDETGSVLVKQGDQVMKDKMGQPRDYKEVLNEFANEKGWIEKQGRGGGNSGSGGSGFKTETEAFKYMEKHGIEPDSNQGQEILQNIEQESAQE